jgi:hypothetical protein
VTAAFENLEQYCTSLTTVWSQLFWLGVEEVLESGQNALEELFRAVFDARAATKEAELQMPTRPADSEPTAAIYSEAQSTWVEVRRLLDWPWIDSLLIASRGYESPATKLLSKLTHQMMKLSQPPLLQCQNEEDSHSQTQTRRRSGSTNNTNNSGFEQVEYVLMHGQAVRLQVDPCSRFVGHLLSENNTQSQEERPSTDQQSCHTLPRKAPSFQHENSSHGACYEVKETADRARAEFDLRMRTGIYSGWSSRYKKARLSQEPN